METVKIEFQGTQAGDNFKTDASDLTVVKEDEDKAKALVQSVYDAADVINDLQSQVETLEGEKAMLEEAATISPERLDAEVKARTEVLDTAARAGLKAEELRADDVDVIRRKIVATRTDLAEDASDDFVQGCYNMIRADVKKASDNKKKFRDLGENTSGRMDTKELERMDEDDMSPRERSEAARQDMHLKTDAELRKDWN